MHTHQVEILTACLKNVLLLWIVLLELELVLFTVLRWWQQTSVARTYDGRDYDAICCKAHTPLVQIGCELVCTIYRQQIKPVEFEPDRARVCHQPTAVGLCSKVLSIIGPTFVAWWSHSASSSVYSTMLSFGHQSASADILVFCILMVFWCILEYISISVIYHCETMVFDIFVVHLSFVYDSTGSSDLNRYIMQIKW